MQSIDSYIPVTQAKSSLLELVRQIKDHDKSIAITKNGVPEAIMISLDRFDGLLETIDIMADEKQMRSIRKSLKEADKGQWIDVSTEE